MTGFNESILFPLATVTQETLASLCQALWGWRPCLEWISGGQVCGNSILGCPCERAAKLEPFFDYYRLVTAYYLPDDVGHSHPALASHDDLIRMISLLLDNSDTPRSQLTADYFKTRRQQCRKEPPASDQDRAFNLAARIAAMVQPSGGQQFEGLLEAGVQPVVWRSDTSFTAFLHSVFPKRQHPALSPGDQVVSSARVSLASITGHRLKKVAGLDIIPTNDLREHLALDEKKGTVSLFHYTSVLKEHLSGPGQEASGQRRDSEKGTLKSGIPPQLALETLVTIKEVLFPDDAASQSALRTLVAKKQLDPDILRIVDSPAYHAGIERPLGYQYWGSRLMDLHEELEHPTPRGVLWRWLERKSGARYAMMATLVGVLIAVILGIFSLAVSIFQAWVGWQQWQHPLSNS